VLVVGARPEQIGELRKVVQRTLSSHFALAVTRLIFVPRGEIPKTPSGKLQRALVRQRVLEDSIVKPVTPFPIRAPFTGRPHPNSKSWKAVIPSTASTWNRMSVRMRPRLVVTFSPPRYWPWRASTPSP